MAECKSGQFGKVKKMRDLKRGGEKRLEGTESSQRKNRKKALWAEATG